MISRCAIRPPPAPTTMLTLATELSSLTAREMMRELGLMGLPTAAQVGVAAALSWGSRRLGNVLARFDERVGVHGLSRAATASLEELGARWTVHGEVPRQGALLVLANHPGAYDSLLLFSAVHRPDLAVLAADRALLRALPRLRHHLLFVPGDAAVEHRALVLRDGLDHLALGRAVLHFPAGRIEPDPAFAVPGTPCLLEWSPATALLARGALRAGGRVLCALTSGVHSPGAKRAWVTRLAERRGITTVAPLLQVVLRRFHDVEARVCFDEPLDSGPLLTGSNDNEAWMQLLRDRMQALVTRLERI